MYTNIPWHIYLTYVCIYIYIEGLSGESGVVCRPYVKCCRSWVIKLGFRHLRNKVGACLGFEAIEETTGPERFPGPNIGLTKQSNKHTLRSQCRLFLSTGGSANVSKRATVQAGTVSTVNGLGNGPGHVLQEETKLAQLARARECKSVVRPSRFDSTKTREFESIWIRATKTLDIDQSQSRVLNYQEF